MEAKAILRNFMVLALNFWVWFGFPLGGFDDGERFPLPIYIATEVCIAPDSPPQKTESASNTMALEQISFWLLLFDLFTTYE